MIVFAQLCVVRELSGSEVHIDNVLCVYLATKSGNILRILQLGIYIMHIYKYIYNNTMVAVTIVSPIAQN